MSDSEDVWSIKDFLGGLVGGGILTGLGVWMIINPDGGSDQEAVGGRSWAKNLLNDIWGVPGGIIVGFIGLVIIWLTIDQIMKQQKRS